MPKPPLDISYEHRTELDECDDQRYRRLGHCWARARSDVTRLRGSHSWNMLYRTNLFALLITFSASAQTNTSYQAGLNRLGEQRMVLARECGDPCRPSTEALDSARTILLDAIIERILPAWYGTPWDFNGMTRVPGKGSIACGYFVNTVLQDAGFNIPRILWSQLAAERMILKVAPHVRRFRDVSVVTVEQWLAEQGDGLYAVGLDSHVGFVTRRKGINRFVHSNYYQRDIGVMAEPLSGHNPFAHSRYRVIGKLLDDAMMRAWLQGTSLEKP